ncbi:MAG: aminotransferase class I/II-fold pyridoxal phosphate-dependent enzyme [Caldilineaceae bacterium]
MPLPNYAVNLAQLSLLKPLAVAKHVHTKRENNFLPTFADIKAEVTENTVAIILTYPTNPSQATYEGERLSDLTAMINFCQEQGIFLIVDNIYQDLLFPIGRASKNYSIGQPL